MDNVTWHLLNQHYVNLDSRKCEISVLEEVLSSELQLVLLLASGTVSLKTMTSVGQVDYNQVDLTGVCLT